MAPINVHGSVAAVRLPLSVDALSPAFDRQLRAVARRRTLMKHENLYWRGAAPDAIYCVESGAVQLSTTSVNGKESVLGVVEPGRWFGELALFTKDPRPHDAKALTTTEMLVVSERCLHDIVDHQPSHLLEILRLVCRRYKWAIDRFDASVLQPLPVRLAHLLVAEAQSFSSQPASQSSEIKLPQESLGHMLGASRQSINRLLKLWEAQGVLRVTYGKITLLKPDYLIEMQMQMH